MGAIIDIDLTARTYRSAFQFARVLAVAGDRKGADALMCRLLWHVRAEDGGFIGLSDQQLADKIDRDPKLNAFDVDAAMYDPGEWPAISAAQQVAA
jgi:hypothetical protein